MKKLLLLGLMFILLSFNVFGAVESIADSSQILIDPTNAVGDAKLKIIVEDHDFRIEEIHFRRGSSLSDTYTFEIWNEAGTEKLFDETWVLSSTPYLTTEVLTNPVNLSANTYYIINFTSVNGYLTSSTNSYNQTLNNMTIEKDGANRIYSTLSGQEDSYFTFSQWTPICSLDSLFACTNQTSCEAINGTFYNNTCYDFKNSLISYYSFDVDASDDYSNNDGTATGATHTTTLQKVGDGAYDFTNSDYITMTNESFFDFAGSNSSFSFWLYLDSSGQDAKRIINKNSGGIDGYSIYLASGKMVAWYGDGTAPTFYRITSSTVPANEWVYVTITNDGTSSTSGTHIYWNGAEVSASNFNTGTSLVDNNEPFTIGKSGGLTIDGKIDEVSIYNDILTSSEILVLNASINPLTYNASACNLNQLENCDTQTKCDSVNGTFYNSTCYDFRTGMYAYFSYDIDTSDDYSTNDATAYNSPVHTTTIGEYKLGSGGYDFSGGLNRKISTGGFVLNALTEASWCAWHKTTTDGAKQCYLGSTKSGGSDWAAGCVALTTGYNWINIRYAGTSHEAVGTTNIGDNAWHFSCVTWDKDGIAQLYTDGVNVANTTSLGGTTPNYYELYVGTINKPDASSQEASYDGSIDEVMLWDDKILTNDEVEVLYNNNIGLNPLTYNASACNLNQLENCDTQTKCDSVNGTFYNSTCYDFRSNMLAYYSLDIDARDDYSGTYNGIPQGSVTHTTTLQKLGDGAYVFDGSNDWININSIPIQTYDSVSVVAWINTSTTSNGRMTVIGKTYIAWSIWLGKNLNDGKFVFTPSSGITDAEYAISDSELNDGKFHLLVGTWDGSNVKLYVDGVLQTDTGTSTSIPSNSDYLSIGSASYSGGNDYFFDGVIDEGQLYDTALTQEEVEVLYNQGTGMNPLTYVAPSNVTGNLTVSVTSPLNTTYTSTNNISIDFNASASGTATLDSLWYYNGTANVSYTTPQNLVLPNNNYTFIFYANDTDSNIYSTNISFQVYYIVYNLSITHPITNLNYATTELNYTTDATDSCWYSTDFGATNSSAVSAGTDFTGLTSTEGNNNWTVYCNSTYNVQVSNTTNFVVDTIPPSITLESPTSTLTDNSSILINITTSDSGLGVDKVWYFNGTDNVTYTTPETINLSDGDYTLFFYVNDTVGNMNQTDFTFRVDTSLPTISIYYPTDPFYNDTISEFKYVTDSLESCWYSTDFGVTNSSAVSSGTNFTGVTSVAGDNNWTVYCNNTFGSVTSNTTNFYVDLVAPTLTVESPMDLVYNTSQILINLTTSDGAGVGVDTIWYFNGTDNVTYTIENTITVTDGDYTFNFYVNDSFNHITNENVSFTVDTTYPSLVVNSPIETIYSNSEVLINITATDTNLDQVWYDNGTANVTYTTAGNITILDGFYNFTFYANDTANNINSTSVNFTVDANGPLITIHSPLNQSYGYNNILINFTAIDVVSSVDSLWYFNGSSNVSYTTPITQIFADGPHTLIMYANDTMNNINSKSISFKVNTSAPSVIIDTPISTNYSTNVLDINYTTNGDDVCWYDNGTVLSAEVSAGTNFSSEIASEGDNTWTLYCNNTLGITGSDSVFFTVDTIAPTINVTSPVQNGIYNNQTILINFTGTDVHPTTQWFNNGTDNISYTVPVYFDTLTDGNKSYTFYINDSLGNLNQTTINFTIDTLNPVINLYSPNPDNSTVEINGTTILFNLTFEDTNLLGYNITCIDNVSGLPEYSRQNITVVGSTAELYENYQFTNPGIKVCNVIASESIGGLNTAELNFSFEIVAGKLVNYTATNIFDSSSINTWNLTLTDSYNGTRFYNTTTNNISNVKVFYYDTTSTAKASGYYNTNITVLNGSIIPDTVDYKFWQTEVTINVRDLVSSSLVPGSDITIYNNTIPSNHSVLNSVTGSELFKIDIGSYNILVEGDTFPSVNDVFNSSTVGVYTKNIYVSGNFTLFIRDEATEGEFNISSPDSIIQYTTCTDGTVEKLDLATVSYQFIVPCAFEKIRFVVNYPSDRYYRTFLPKAFDIFSNTTDVKIWLVDLNTHQIVFNTFELYALNNEYINTKVYFKKFIGDTEYVITSDYLNIEEKIGTYFLLGEQYTVEIEADNYPTTNLGFYTADTAGEKIIRLFEIQFNPGDTTAYKNELFSTSMDDSTGVNRIKVEYTSKDVESSTLKIYNNTENNSNLIYTTTVLTSNSSVFYYIPPTVYENETFIVNLNVTKIPSLENYSRLYNGIVRVNSDINLGIVDEGFISEEFLSIFLIVILSVIALIFSYSTADIGSLVIVGLGGLFYYFGWLGIAGVTLALAVLISVINFIKKRDISRR